MEEEGEKWQKVSILSILSVPNILSILIILPQILSKGSSAEEVKGAFRAATLSMARFRSSLQLFAPQKPLEIVKPQFVRYARLNRTGAQLMQKHKAGAATDVTG